MVLNKALCNKTRKLIRKFKAIVIPLIPSGSDKVARTIYNIRTCMLRHFILNIEKICMLLDSVRQTQKVSQTKSVLHFTSVHAGL